MVSVVHAGHFRQHFPGSKVQFVRHAADVGREVVAKFLFRDAADGMEILAHGDVLQTVQAAEHAQLAELRHTREHGETYVPVTGLQGAVKGLQCAAVLVLQSLVADGLQHGFVVFVHEDDHTMSRLGIRLLDDISKPLLKNAIFLRVTVDDLPFLQIFVQYTSQCFGILVVTGVQVKVQDGVSFPLRL